VQNSTRNRNINIEPVDVTHRTNRSRVIVKYVGVKLCRFFCNSEGRTWSESAEGDAWDWGGGRGRAADGGGRHDDGLRGWKTWTGLIWLRILRISGLM